MAVVLAHTARADTANRQVVLAKLNQGVIDANAAGNNRVECFIQACAIAIKGVKRQWSIVLQNLIECLLVSVVTLQRQ